MDVRAAAPEDAAEICAVVRASIIALCGADHHDDPQILKAWLANKTPEDIARWIADPDNINLVVAQEGAILAAGCVTVGGEVVLNYVRPAERFRGASSALLTALEAAARGAGNLVCRLDSTATAHRFYQARGFEDCAPPTRKFGLTAWPMRKTL